MPPNNECRMFLDRFEKQLMRFNRWLLIAILGVMSLIIFTNVGLR